MFFLHARHKQYVNSFTPQYKQGAKCYATIRGKRRKVKISGAQLNRYGSFVAWLAYLDGNAILIKDPKCPWNLLGQYSLLRGRERKVEEITFIKDFVE